MAPQPLRAPDNELFWFRVRKVFARWWVYSSNGHRSFSSYKKAAVYANRLASQGFANGDTPDGACSYAPVE